MFNLNNVQEFTGATVLAPGQYNARIESAEVTVSKSKNKMIKVVFAIEGGLKLFDYVTLESLNPKAVDIGLRRAKSILLATGYQNMNFRNDIEMARAMRGSLVLTLGVKDEIYNGETKQKNIIKKYSPMQGGYKISNQPSQDSQFDTTDIPF